MRQNMSEPVSTFSSSLNVIARLREEGICLTAAMLGENRASCPKCAKRTRDTALSVRLDEGGAFWHCHRCGWGGRTCTRTLDLWDLAYQQQKREETEERKNQRAANVCNQLWRTSRPAHPAHKYLREKGVPRFCSRQRGGNLVLPVIDTQRRIRTLQYITPAGLKRLHPGGAKRGHFIPVASTAAPCGTVIAEGFATAATLVAEFEGWRIVAAIDCHNLHPVAEALAAISDRIVIAADPDPAGLAGARAAARAVDGEIVVPDWPDDAPDPTGDFNDLRQWMREVRNAAYITDASR